MKKIFSLFFITAFVFSLCAAQTDEQIFLSANKKKKGVITTASGLQYEIITKGSGKKPSTSNQVRVHYIGTLINGTEFDNSYKRSAVPTVFPLNAVITGWQEGLQLMSVGSKYKFYIPSSLGYGTNGAGKLIKPNETLIFVVDLIGIIGVDDPQAPEKIANKTTTETPAPTKTETKPVVKTQAETERQTQRQTQPKSVTTTVATNTTTTSNTSSASNEFNVKLFEEQINTLLLNPSNNFKNCIGEEITSEERNFYATHYKTNVDISGVGKGEKITKYPTEKKWVYYAESNGLSKQNASDLVDKILKEMKKLKLPFSYTETVQYNVATRRLITLNFLNEYKQPVGMDMGIDALAGSDAEGAFWKITIRITKKMSAQY